MVVPDRMRWMHGDGSGSINSYDLNDTLNRQWYAIMAIMADNRMIQESPHELILLDRWVHSLILFAQKEMRNVPRDAEVFFLTSILGKMPGLITVPDRFIHVVCDEQTLVNRLHHRYQYQGWPKPDIDEIRSIKDMYTNAFLNMSNVFTVDTENPLEESVEKVVDIIVNI